MKPVLTAILAFGLLVSAGAGHAARADFGAPVTLSRPGQQASDAEVAIDADGDAVVVWERFNGTNWRIEARARSAAGVFGPLRTLSAAGHDALFPQVAIDADGDAVVVWRRFDGTNTRIQARSRSAADVLSPVQTLSAAGQNAGLAQVAVDADGDAVIVWQRFDGANTRIEARARSFTGVLGPVETLSDAGQNADSPHVAVDAIGNAVAVWRGENDRIQVRARSSTGVLGPVETLSGRNADVSPKVAMNAGGNAVVVWSRSDRIQARSRSFLGVLGPIQNLSADGAAKPQVAVDAEGDAVFVWERPDGTNLRVQARARSAAGVLGSVQTLSAVGQDAFDGQVAVDADGDAVFVWQRGFIDGRIQARTRSAAGVLAPRQTFSHRTSMPQVAVAADGDAVAVWSRFDGANNRMKAAAGP